MTEWLVRRFVKNYQDVENPRVRTAYGLFASIVGIVCNLLLSLGKGLVGLASGSVAIVADAVNNLSDASSNIISLLGFKLASRPADHEHPYGHGRMEYLAGLTVAVLVRATMPSPRGPCLPRCSWTTAPPSPSTDGRAWRWAALSW